MSRYRLSFSGPPIVEVDNQAVTLPTRKSLALLAFLAVEQKLYHRNQLLTIFWPDLDQGRGRAALRRELSRINKVLGDEWRVIEGETVQISEQVTVDVLEAEQWLDEDRVGAKTAVSFNRGEFLAGFGIPDSPDFDLWQQQQATKWQATRIGLLLNAANGNLKGETAVSLLKQAVAIDPLNENSNQQLIQTYLAQNQSITAQKQYDQFAALLETELNAKPPSYLTQLLQSRPLIQQDDVVERSPENHSISRRFNPRILVLGALVVGLLSMGIWWGRQQWLGLQNQVDVATSNQLVAQAQAATDPDLKLLLALAAYHQEPSMVSEEALFGALNSLPPHFVTSIAHETAVTALATKPSEQLLAVGLTNGDIYLYDTGTFEPVGQVMSGHERRIMSLKFLPNDELLVSASQDGTIRFWDIETQSQIGGTLTHESGSINDIDVDLEGKFLLSGGSDQTVRLWDLSVSQTNPPLIGQPVQAHEGAVLAVEFLHAEEVFATGGTDGEVIEWFIQENLSIRKEPIDVYSEQHSGSVNDIASMLYVGFDSVAYYASVGLDGKLIEYYRPSFQANLNELMHDISAEAVVFGHSEFYSAGLDGQILSRPVQIDFVPPPFQFSKIDAGIFALAFDEQLDLLFSGDEDGNVIIWDINQTRPFIHKTGARDDVTLAFQSAEELFVANGYGQVRILDQGLENIDFVRFEERDNDAKHWLFPVEGLAVFSVGTTVHFHPERTSSWTFDTKSPIAKMVASSDGSLIGIGTLSGEVIVFDWATRQVSFKFQNNNAVVNDLIFSANGESLLVGLNNQRVIVYDLENRNSRRRRLSDEPTAVSVSPNYDLIAIGLEDGSIQLFHFENNRIGNSHSQYDGHDEPITDLSFDGSGNRLASASWDSNIQLWDVATGASILLDDHERGVSDLAWSPNGRYLASAGWDNRIIRWDLNVELWQETACLAANRNLTEEEWSTYLPNEPFTLLCQE